MAAIVETHLQTVVIVFVDDIHEPAVEYLVMKTTVYEDNSLLRAHVWNGFPACTFCAVVRHEYNNLEPGQNCDSFRGNTKLTVLSAISNSRNFVITVPTASSICSTMAAYVSIARTLFLLCSSFISSHSGSFNPFTTGCGVTSFGIRPISSNRASRLSRKAAGPSS